MTISRDNRAALRMRCPKRLVMTVQTDQLDVTPEEAAALIRETGSRFIKDVSVSRSGAVKIQYLGATPARIKQITARVLVPHITPNGK